MELRNNIYVFSGLGADKRVFQKIDFGDNNVEFINWIKPLKNEILADYSKRITKQIIKSKPILIGISFGGIVAQEVSNIIEIEKLILLATIENRNELPYYLKILGNLKIDKVIPAKILKAHNFVTNFFFGVKTKMNSEILKVILKETDEEFLKWALRKIAEWKPLQQLKTISKITIHGTKDRVLPISGSKKYDYVITDGGHFFTLTHFNQINEILRTEL